MLLVEVQIGGIGIMVIIGTLLMLFRGKISINQQSLLTQDTNQKNRSSIKKLTVFIITYAFIIETIGAIYFYIHMKVNHTEGEDALMTAIFHAISSFTNAGFEIFENGMVFYQNQGVFLLITSLLIILGAIGFPSVMELVMKRKNKISLYTKINILMHGILLTVGTVLIGLLEWKDGFVEMDIWEKVTNAIFFSATTRSGGFETISVMGMTQTTLFLMVILMFIGGSASSSSGGIRVTTFFIILVNAFKRLTGKTEIVVFKKTLYEEDIQKAQTIFTSFIFIFIVSTLIISSIENQGILPIVFEVMSAMTTTGLSLGVTDELTAFSKVFLCILMVVGRIGIIALIYAITDNKKTRIRYKKEHVIVG